MNSKTFIIILSVVTLGFSSCCNYTQTSTSMKSETDTASFYIGYSFGAQLKGLGVTDPNISAIIAGINYALTKKDPPAEQQSMVTYINKFIEKKMAERAEKNRKDGEAFLEKNGKKSDVVTTESGLQYKIETKGEGPVPTSSDMVKVHYRGTFLDGTEFDSSIKRGEPFQFQAGGGVIRGWSEAIQLMPVGSKWTLYIPSDLAYGPQGYYNNIAPNETLIFEVELLEIVPQEKPEEAAEHNHEH
ncbi:MAG: FKBP-type peptidyl-prolyl cis-trans isomerase [Odoribacteraceae bacterium]|jgi:FKBP-type peptidyl-prolyl cis-trans isomerase FklB|nr:FKBP-type peptidyl-prolyl cis-trans isomerase [Odoribacteraceae bacterium]